MIASGGLSGGISSYIAGGSFWKGVRQGLITSGLNHAAHAFVKGGSGDPPKNVKKIRGKYYYVNKGNTFAKFGNWVNDLLGGDADYWVEHKPYDPVEEHMMQTFAETGAGFVAGGLVSKFAGGVLGSFAAKGVSNVVPRTKDVLGHIFRNAPGHVNPATVASQNRYIKVFESVANNSKNINANVLTNYQRTAGGFQGYSQTFRNGSQVWVQTRNGKIINAGVNLIPK